MPDLAVIEDNADNRLVVHAMLSSHFTIREYETGQAGLDGIREQRPDVLLLDISLPGMDGMEVLATIRGDAELRDLSVVAFTAHAMAGDREKYLDAGFDDYLTKPIVDDQELIDTLKRWAAADARDS